MPVTVTGTFSFLKKDSCVHEDTVGETPCTLWYLHILMGRIRTYEAGKPVTPYLTPMTRVSRFTSTL
jgi:hypothetical protein